MRTEAEIKFECGQCGQRLSVAPIAAGATVSCPSCEAPLTVPGISAAGQPEDGNAWQEETSSQIAALHEQIRAGAVNNERLEHDLAANQSELRTARQELRAALEDRDNLVGTLAQISADKREGEASLSDAARELGSLRQENQSLRGDLGSAQRELAELREQSQMQKRELEAKGEACSQLEGEAAALKAELTKLHKEVEHSEAELLKLRSDLASTAGGRELLLIRSQLEEVENSRKRAEEALGTARSESARLTTALKSAEQQLAEIRQKKEEAERKVKELGESELHQNNTVLRSIVDRQKSELEHLYSELKRLRGARFGLRLAYALFALGLLALGAWAIRAIPGLTTLF